MNASQIEELLQLVSDVALALCLVLALAAVVLFFTLHIREVRDELTGRTAERAIAQIRQTTWSERRMRESAARRVLGDGSMPSDETSSMRVRSAYGPEDRTTVTAASEDATTIVGDAGSPSEDATTIVEDES